MFPGLRTTCSPGLTPSRISTPSSVRRPVLMRFSDAVPSLTVNTRSMPANVTTDAAGTSRARYPAATTISARENAPGRRMRAEFETSVSTSNVRLVSSKEGLIRATRPWWVPGAPSTVTRTGWPIRIMRASRSGTAVFNRNGCICTTVTTGVPADRYCPTFAFR